MTAARTRLVWCVTDDGKVQCKEIVEGCDPYVLAPGESWHQPMLTCTGPWTHSSNPTGWLGITTGTRIPAAWTTIVDWRTIATFTTAACITDGLATTDLGTLLHYARDTRIYHLIDARYLVNGTVVATHTNRAYPYSDERTEALSTEPLQYEWEHGGVDTQHLLNIPASASIGVQVRHRLREGAPQDTPWSRAYVGLRSQAALVTVPRTIVTGGQS